MEQVAAAVPPTEAWTQFGIAGMLIAGLVFLGAMYINKLGQRSAPDSSQDSTEKQVIAQLNQMNEKLIAIIKDNTEASAQLIKAVETQTRTIESLVVAINQLIGRLSA